MKINYVQTESGDWCSLYVNGEQWYEGHSISTQDWLKLIESIVPASSTEFAEFPDERMEEFKHNFPEFYWRINEVLKEIKDGWV